MDAGLPAAAVVAWDPYPTTPASFTGGSMFLTNERARQMKAIVRTAFTIVSSKKYWQLFLHSADDDSEAWEYIGTFASDGERREIAQTVSRLRREWHTATGAQYWNATQFPNIADITGGVCA
eukprot:m.23306 g.23306  ORF g.23306 m.23306 type:complete len:122 (-) comp12935_c0_seq1:234-599(-)